MDKIKWIKCPVASKNNLNLFLPHSNNWIRFVLKHYHNGLKSVKTDKIYKNIDEVERFYVDSENYYTFSPKKLKYKNLEANCTNGINCPDLENGKCPYNHFVENGKSCKPCPHDYDSSNEKMFESSRCIKRYCSCDHAIKRVANVKKMNSIKTPFDSISEVEEVPSKSSDKKYKIGKNSQNEMNSIDSNDDSKESVVNDIDEYIRKKNRSSLASIPPGFESDNEEKVECEILDMIYSPEEYKKIVDKYDLTSTSTSMSVTDEDSVKSDESVVNDMDENTFMKKNRSSLTSIPSGLLSRFGTESDQNLYPSDGSTNRFKYKDYSSDDENENFEYDIPNSYDDGYLSPYDMSDSEFSNDHLPPSQPSCNFYDLNDNLIYSTQDSLNRDYKRNKSSKKQINKKDCSDFQIGVDLLKEVEQYSQEQERDYQNYLDYVHNNMSKNNTSTLIMTKESYINSPKSAKKFWTDKFDEELEFKLEKGLSCFMSIQNTSVKSH